MKHLNWETIQCLIGVMRPFGNRSWDCGSWGNRRCLTHFLILTGTFHLILHLSFLPFTLLLLLYPSPTGLLDCVEYSSQFRQPVAVYRRNALHVLFRCKQELVVYDVIGGVTHPVLKRTSRVEMTRHAISHIHVLSNSLNTSCLMEVSSADTLAYYVPFKATGG